jgi:hypothetical protein
MLIQRLDKLYVSSQADEADIKFSYGLCLL